MSRNRLHRRRIRNVGRALTTAVVASLLAALATAAVASTTALPTTVVAPPGAPQRIEFAPGTDNATVSGTFGVGVNVYVLRAEAGQRLDFPSSDPSGLAFTLVAPSGAAAAGDGAGGFRLAESGDWRIEVQPAASGATTYSFTVRIVDGEDTVGECRVDPQTPAITAHLGDIPPAAQVPGVPWSYSGESNYNPCFELSYAAVTLEGATVSSPDHLMLFHRGEYVGTATECAFGFVVVVDSTESSVTVDYYWPREGDPNAAPSGRASVSYSWSGSEVVTSGSLPAELLAISGCAADSGTTTPSASTPSASSPQGTLPTTR
jgi:hypothetical protein